MSDGDGDDEAPLADLLDDIEGDDAGDDVWDRLAEELGEEDGESRGAAATPDDGADDPEDGFEWLRRADEDGGADESRSPEEATSLATVSNTAKIVHGYLTVLSLGVALSIYVAAVLGVVPREAWLLSLPPFALGVVLLIPVLAWQFGVWDPARIA